MLLNLLAVLLSASELFFSKDLNLLNHLGTRTPYRFVSSTDNFVATYPGCEPEKAWVVIRHGTRYPKKEAIQQMNSQLPLLRDLIVCNREKGKGELSEFEINNLKKWSPILKESDDTKLTHEGEDEMIILAERFQQRFPKIFTEIYSNSSYKFKFTATQRTLESARYFTIGLFGRKVSNHVWFPEPLDADPILRFYKLCQRWQKNVKKNPKASEESQKFKQSAEVENMMNNIKQRLGLNESLSYDLLQLVYSACGFETASNHKNISPWCFVFNERDIKVLEYEQDLKYYWIDGFGFNLTYAQACPIFKDWISFFEEENESQPKVVAYFTHSGTILKFLAHLGLYEDNHILRHNNFHLLGNRKWRVSKIDSFGSNIAFIKYRCADEIKVLTLHQEKIVSLPLCKDKELCPLKHIKSAYQKSLNACDFQSMCALRDEEHATEKS